MGLRTQSGKALRGKDMADVIFKGSAGSGRKPANSAEATLIFDNSSQSLSIDAAEVQVTRRVYRSGDSEYLINGQASRLKDVKNLFRGTGVGVDAYSLIEQGKVDRMLQASPKDRRVIFEEAAGISRFNAKKAEAERRVQRVEQNLVRLKDIVDEVHTRLQSLKSQAGKAQRYREMTHRLHDIRLRLGWTEYCQLQTAGQTIQSRLDQLQQQRDGLLVEVESARDEARTADQALHLVAQQCQQVEADLQTALQRIAVAQNQQQSIAARGDESLQEWRRHSRRLGMLQRRAQEVQLARGATRSEVVAAQSDHARARLQVEASETEVSRLRSQLTLRATQHDQLRREHVQLLREVSEQVGEIAQQENLLNQLVQTLRDTEQSLVDNRTSEQSLRKSAERAASRLKQLYQENAATATELAQARAELEENRTLLSKHQEEAGLLQGRLAGASDRLRILEELQQQGEGVDAGARHLLSLKSQPAQAALQSVYGLVADLVQVDVSLAPLIDTSLGPAANALVLRDGQLIELIRSGQLPVPGRLTLMRLDRVPHSRFGEKVQLDGVDGVIGRADRLIRCRRETLPLIRYLLGTTWLVESLDVAMELGHFRGAGLRFVTADCQLLEADGTITLGSLSTCSGLVSRRSEIQSTTEEIALCKSRYQKLHGEIERVQGRIQRLRPSLEQLEHTAHTLAQEFAHQQATAQNAVARLDEFEQRAIQLAGTLEETQRRRQQVEPVIRQLQASVAACSARIATIEHELSSHESAVREYEGNFAAASDTHLAAQVELARTEQRLETVQALLDQNEQACQERLQAVDEARTELHRMSGRRLQAELEILRLTSQLADDYRAAEANEAVLDELARQATALRDRRTTAAKHLESVTRALDRATQQFDNGTGELQRCQQSSQALLQRYRDDYQIELQTMQSVQVIEDRQEIEALNTEAARLRQDISAVGEINMTALAELDQLQQRYDHLHGQYQDLQAAKESLQRIIQKINGDSRRLFQETLEAIRQNFQKLYRQAFGGGHADIVLEEGADILECGIDLVATPPGKTAFSNSLLSGGEKALTAVALLLAIFQYRPSPFCVLDEVDAPFDEANIGRFVNVLGDFLDWTKFIIVTHSKKTMTAATTLYGVTMQESGVSKQVAVRFEDVNEKGKSSTGRRRIARPRDGQ